MVSKIQKSMFNFFAILLDDTTDVASLAQLCVYVCCVDEKLFEDEFLFCEPVCTKATANEMFDE